LRRELEKFENPEVVTEYRRRYGDPLEEVEPGELMELMESLWASRAGAYAQLREDLRRDKVDPWGTRIKLTETYFRNQYFRINKLDAEKDRSKILDIEDFIDYLVFAKIREHQEAEEQEARFIRDRHTPRF